MTTTSVLLTVAAAGTPQQFTSNTDIRGFRIDFMPKVGNTTRSVVGSSGLSKSTLAFCLAEFGSVAANSTPPSLTVEDDDGNSLRLSDFWGDVDTNGEAILAVVYTK